MIEHLAFAALLLVFTVPLAAAFAPDDLATLRRWRQRWRVRRYATAWHRDGVDLLFRMAQEAATRPDRRIRTLPRHRLGGAG